MYLNYFGLTEEPFSIAPDPRYLYMSHRHQEALAHLLYGVNGGGGFVLLTGEVGAGKTTVCRCLLEQIPDSCDVAYIFNPKLTVEELLSTICAEFGIACPPGNASANPSVKVYVDCINAYLLDAYSRGRHTVLIIDEAQNLSSDVLEQLRLLTNLETNQRKLLQIILLGQPELAAMLAQPELRQLAQRVIARYHLGPLSRQEVAAYVQHRLCISGTQRQLFPAALMGSLYRLSGGVPRIINVLCDRALLGAYAQSKERVDYATLKQAAHEVFHNPAAQRRSLVRPLLAALLASTVLAAAAYLPVAPSRPPAKAEIKPEPVKPAAVLPVTLEWPAAYPFTRSQELAYAALFNAWGAGYQGGDACQQAEMFGLHCREARGGLGELRQLNRPAVLQMRDKLDQKFYATLIGLDGQTATFAVGAETRTVALGALAEQWSGHYMLLLRLSPVDGRNIRPGERGPEVEWLGRQLALLDGKAAETAKDQEFDEAMIRKVKQFQLAQGLTPDGAVGPQTVMRLSEATDTAAPKLMHGQTGR